MEADAESRAAGQLALTGLTEKKLSPEEYKLVRAENLLKGSASADPQAWRVTFKRRALIPADGGGVIGAGGEVFVEVNLATRAVKVTGYGE